jgi:hypothetical protein
MSNPGLLALARRNLGGGDVHIGRNTTPYGPGPVFSRSNASAYTEKKPGMDNSMHKNETKKDSSPKKKRKKEDDDDSGSDSDDDGGDSAMHKRKDGLFKKDRDGDGKTGEGKNKKMDWKDRNKNGRPDGMEKK